MVELVNVDEDGDPCGDIRCPFGSPETCSPARRRGRSDGGAIRDESTWHGLGTVSYRADSEYRNPAPLHQRRPARTARVGLRSTSASRR